MGRRPHAPLRPLRVAAAAAACALSLLAAAPAASSAAVPPQGVYESCYPGLDLAGCNARVKRLGDAGFRVVVNYWLLRASSAADVAAYVDAAYASGVKVIWNLNDFSSADLAGTNVVAGLPKLAADCGCSTNGELLDYIVGLAKNRPGTWGYYIADEPDTSRSGQLAAFVDRVKSLDPGHPRLLVACGVCAGGDPTGSRALPFSGLDVTLGTDLYPVVGQPPNASFAGNQVAAGMRGLQDVATSAGRESAVVLQAFSWGFSSWDAPICGSSPANCRFPTRDEMVAQRNGALRGGKPRLILWYALFDVIGTLPEQRRSDWTPVPNPEERWNDLLVAAFGAEPASDPPATPPAPPAKAGKLGPVRVSNPIRGRRRVGRLQLIARFSDSSARLELRSGRLRVRGARRFLVRSCIVGDGKQRCRKRWRRNGGSAPRVALQVARPAISATDTVFSGRVTIFVRGRRGTLVRVAASSPRVRVPAASRA